MTDEDLLSCETRLPVASEWHPSPDFGRPILYMTNCITQSHLPLRHTQHITSARKIDPDTHGVQFILAILFLLPPLFSCALSSMHCIPITIVGGDMLFHFFVLHFQAQYLPSLHPHAR